jgi:phosphoribosylformylglycinamidine synthase
LLLEATLEVIQTGAVVGVQDMGAAGISCSSSEMSAKGKCGMHINLDLVPMREEGMTSYELLLSESQERMLIVAEDGREQEIIDIYEKWDLNAVVIGEVIDDDRVIYEQHGEVKADIPADSLVLGGGAPQYVRETKKPDYIDDVQGFDFATLEHPTDHGDTLMKLLSDPNIASKKWVFEQYDTMVRTNTIQGPGPSDAGVVRLKGTKRALAVKTDCNGRYVYLNPKKGGMIAVAEAARNVVCTGAKPLAVTNCLNFGNPYKPEVYWTFKEALAGMGEACRGLNTPVTGGNVSFYNENPNQAVNPSPVIGMLGLIDDYEEEMTTAAFQEEGDVVYYIGADRVGLGGSQYIKAIHNLTTGDAPEFDLDFEIKLQKALLEAIKADYVTAAHDISDGGLAVTLAEMAMFGNKGAKLDLLHLEEMSNSSPVEVLFSEAQSGVVITVNTVDEDDLAKHMKKAGIPMVMLGRVTGETLNVDGMFEFSIDELKQPYESVIPDAMKS